MDSRRKYNDGLALDTGNYSSAQIASYKIFSDLSVGNNADYTIY